MPNLPVLSGLLLVLGSAFVGGILARRLRQPVVFGYLLAGIAVSFLISRWGWSRNNLNLLAETGSSLLMFTLGLELSFRKPERLKKTIIGGSLGLVLAFILTAALALHFLLGFRWNLAVVLAGAFSISSSAIVVKLLEEKNLQESLQGEIMLGSLLVQDLLVLPLIGVFSFFFSRGGGRGIFLLETVLLLFLTWVGARKLAPRLADFIAGLRSRELLLLFSVALVFSLSLLTASLGFSFALGAFLAGLILSGTEENLAIFSEIRPLRDVFLVVFFVSLGLSLEPSFLLANWEKILLTVGLVVGLKIGLSVLILAYFGYHAKIIGRAALGLSQAGEFSFALAGVALAGHFLDLGGYSLAVSVALLTMVLTFWLFPLGEILYRKIAPFLKKSPGLYKKFCACPNQDWPLPELPFADHVVILGYGRVGKWVGNLLEKVRIPYLVVEYNPRIIRQLKLEGKKAVFGDPTDINVLDFAQVDKARLAIVTIPDPLTQKAVIANCRALNPGVQIICRSHVEDDFKELKSLGVETVIQPEFEAALSMSHRILQSFGFDREEVYEKIREIKKEHEKS